MRVENGGQSQQAASKGKDFKAELKKAQPKPQQSKLASAPPKSTKPAGPAQLQKPLASVKQAAAQLDAVLSRSQKAASTFAHSLVERRAEAEVIRPDIKQVAQKIAGLLARDDEKPQSESREPEPKQKEFAAQPIVVAQQVQQQVQSTQAVQPAPRAESLANQIEKLLDRAELIAKAEGPALKLGLSEGRAASIEVVRTGKGEVSLRLDARSPADRRALATQVKAIRESLAQRGLKVRDVRVA